jgi:hypothetical protein
MVRPRSALFKCRHQENRIRRPPARCQTCNFTDAILGGQIVGQPRAAEQDAWRPVVRRIGTVQPRRPPQSERGRANIGSARCSSITRPRLATCRLRSEANSRGGRVRKPGAAARAQAGTVYLVLGAN